MLHHFGHHFRSMAVRGLAFTAAAALLTFNPAAADASGALIESGALSRVASEAQDTPTSPAVDAQEAAPQAAAGGDAEAEDGETEESDEKSLEETVADYEQIDSLFTLYRDPESGKLFMEVSDEQLGQEYIYFVHTVDGVPAAGHFRGFYRGEAVFTVQKHYQRIEFVGENTRYHFDEDSALANAADANLTDALVYSGEITATSADGTRYLIEADALFKTEALHRVKLPRLPDASPFQFTLGKLDGDKTKVTEINAFERNLDVVVDYTYNNSNVLSWPSPAITDPRYVTISIQHSFIEMPDDGFTPHFADQRVGYFTHQVTDQTNIDDITPYRDLVNRWRLEKQDPDADLSDPVQPIVFWMEDTTPEQYRDIIRDAALRWNEAFETAGISNAIQVKQQGVDGDCPAGRIDCNVLRWTSSPQPVFGGYGPSFYNPRTGEILGADIMLEMVWLRARNRAANVYEGPAALLNAHADSPTHNLVERAVDIVGQPGGVDRLTALIDDGAFAQARHDRALFAPASGRDGIMHHSLRRHCAHAEYVQHNLRFALQALDARGAPDAEKERLIEESIYELVLHEIGHTLGLSHNMKASQLHPLADLHNVEVTGDTLVGSIMDYAPVNIAPVGVEQGRYYSTRPGPYDKWAIEFGYRPDLDEEARTALLALSTEPALTFGNDADDMRVPGGWGIDPRVMIGDLSSDAIEHSVHRVRLARATLEGLQEKFTQDGESWHALRDAFNLLAVEQAIAGGVAARYVGGVSVERFVAGQPGSEDLTPFEPLDLETQQKAVEVLREYIFAPDAFSVSEDLLKHLQYERRGFDFFGITEDPKIHEMAGFIQANSLAHVMSPVVLRRMTNARLYGNEYTTNDFLGDLTMAVFEDDANDNVNTYRQNLQIQYVSRLIAIVYLPFYDDVAQSAALSQLRQIRGLITPPLFNFTGPEINAETLAHRRHVQLLLFAVGIF